MNLYICRLKLSIVRYNADLANSKENGESIVTAVVGNDYEWCKHQVFVSGFSDLLWCEKKYNMTLSELREKEMLCVEYEKSSKIDASVIDELRNSQRTKQSAEISALRKLISELKSQLHLEQESYKECKEQLAIAQGQLIDFETYIQSDRGHITMKLEEELAIAKLRIAELESEKDEWDNGDNSSNCSLHKENVHMNRIKHMKG